MSFTAKKAAEKLALRRMITVLIKCSLEVISCVSLTAVISFLFIISLWSCSQSHLNLKLNFFFLKKCNVFVNCDMLWVLWPEKYWLKQMRLWQNLHRYSVEKSTVVDDSTCWVVDSTDQLIKQSVQSDRTSTQCLGTLSLYYIDRIDFLIDLIVFNF